MKSFTLILAFLIISTGLWCQKKETIRNTFLIAGYKEVKEAANFGLVFKGPAFDFGMQWDIFNETALISYEYELGLGILFTREIPGLDFYLKPAELAYMFKLPVSSGNFYVGPSMKLEYSYNLYPDLQAGFDYWMTNFSLGATARYDFNWKSSSFRIKLSSSLGSLVSRQPDYRDPYFYDLGVKYAIEHLHQDMNAVSVNRFFTSQLDLDWKPGLESRIAIGYRLQYAGYYQPPEISSFINSLKLVISKKNGRKET